MYYIYAFCITLSEYLCVDYRRIPPKVYVVSNKIKALWNADTYSCLDIVIT